jgi:hypothetical protein
MDSVQLQILQLPHQMLLVSRVGVFLQNFVIDFGFLGLCDVLVAPSKVQ